MAKSLEERWMKLSEGEKEPYRRLMEKRNNVIEEEIKILDNIIIAKRPGRRSYSGEKLTVRIPEKEKPMEDKMGLNPIFWFFCDDFRKSISDNPNWCNNIMEMQTRTVKKWSTLSKEIQGDCIHRAKNQFEFYTGSTDGNEVVDHNLLITL
ncbi:hypothetical protein DAPPUDRAFT_322426 [Daphnia pulex]|uniref:Uncharacterized protein n=1 Tax=Daphnia pulex TaxID=6669 RepID=E9GVX6_DAPPU|nr:hypothetical protein DAPPUDRAFT_322426 [Daphnia pulex]|eukprot:EFX76372.1 hypothetical protein DAPPUDRAFT_322426 [Daphnia pulex]